MKSKMTIFEVQDKYNPFKVWVIKKSKCNHYYVNQKIHGRLFYSRFSKVKIKSLQKAILFDWKSAHVL